MQSTKGKTVVITGASRGIGAGIAERFAEEEVRLVLCGRDRKALKALTDRLGLARCCHTTVTGDITKPSVITKIADTAERKFGAIDIWINNAGIGCSKPVDETTLADFDAVFALNTRAVFVSLAEILPRMKKQGYGHVINISSMAGRQGVPGLAVYCGSKAALNAICEAAALEVRNDNVKVSVLAPGSVDTGFGGRRPGSKPHALKVSEVAEAVLHLATQDDRTWTSMTEMRPLVVKK